MPEDTLLQRRHRVLGSASPLFYDKPLHLVRGEGVWLFDVDGRRYLDVYNNVPCVGHCNPRVVEAMHRQASTLNIHTRYLDEHVVRYAERLTATFAEPLDTAMFTCTGSEANELALRLARFASGGTGLIVSDYNYHGNSASLAEVTTALPSPEPFASHARAVPIPCLYHAPAGTTESQLAEQYAANIAAAIASMQARGIRPAALLIDTLFANEGLPRVPASFVNKAAALIRAAGGLFIADEVQSGFGRTGDHLWGHQAHGVVPDIVTLGKPMGNGYPLAGLITRKALVESFGRSAMYFNTFGGSPVAAAVGMAVLDEIEHLQLLHNAQSVGAYVQQRLHALAARHSIIGDVRGKGLFFAMELVGDHASKEPAGLEARKVVNDMRDNGVLISKIGAGDNILKLRPPLVFNREHADLFVDTLDHALSAI
ncbi:aspartate aminotransferase family protein [Pseudomonas moorei]|uniref:4-aminobutyrate aminotransferase n=1 Tax=Pseudomonas moorei TaxID=395599 RepID=A0A1H1DDB0_9PSED|nr:aspartate aminotransferase family protein [Pseudomonas moorei]KAB0503783.1 aspartate aminotransferase family protein [Pseudomonas moorei]SDQ74370.1 4-aminobutyrate aminotransferase [Pseudomonas moorei]